MTARIVRVVKTEFAPAQKAAQTAIAAKFMKSVFLLVGFALMGAANSQQNVPVPKEQGQLPQNRPLQVPT